MVVLVLELHMVVPEPHMQHMVLEPHMQVLELHMVLQLRMVHKGLQLAEDTKERQNRERLLKLQFQEVGLHTIISILLIILAIKHVLK